MAELNITIETAIHDALGKNRLKLRAIRMATEKERIA